MGSNTIISGTEHGRIRVMPCKCKQKKALVSAVRWVHCSRAVQAAGSLAGTCLCYVDAVLLTVLALNRFHLVFEAEFEFLKADFFELFVFAEVAFLGECI